MQNVGENLVLWRDRRMLMIFLDLQRFLSSFLNRQNSLACFAILLLVFPRNLMNHLEAGTSVALEIDTCSQSPTATCAWQLLILTVVLNREAHCLWALRSWNSFHVVWVIPFRLVSRWLNRLLTFEEAL